MVDPLLRAARAEVAEPHRLEWKRPAFGPGARSQSADPRVRNIRLEPLLPGRSTTPTLTARTGEEGEGEGKGEGRKWSDGGGCGRREAWMVADSATHRAPRTPPVMPGSGRGQPPRLSTGGQLRQRPSSGPAVPSASVASPGKDSAQGGIGGIPTQANYPTTSSSIVAAAGLGETKRPLLRQLRRQDSSSSTCGAGLYLDDLDQEQEQEQEQQLPGHCLSSSAAALALGSWELLARGVA
mmetsp:Transcript_44940/g.96543  ORF Transcript_44940/g.96543 Transcript_44940/m.96543 type:complete len:239 (-) Transcript_44940:1312-2028(-)